MMTRSLEDIYSYRKDAIESIPIEHPHYKEVYDLLDSQIADELRDAYNNAYSF